MVLTISAHKFDLWCNFISLTGMLVNKHPTSYETSSSFSAGSSKVGNSWEKH